MDSERIDTPIEERIIGSTTTQQVHYTLYAHYTYSAHVRTNLWYVEECLGEGAEGDEHHAQCGDFREGSLGTAY